VLQAVLATPLFVSIGWAIWTGQRMISIGEFASDHATSGYPGAGTWFGFMAAVIIGVASLATLIGMASRSKQRS
jgi:hypothetical protein